MKTVKTATLVIGLATLTGCASLMGESEFSCSGLPEKNECMSARDVYKATANGGSIHDAHVGHGHAAQADDVQVRAGGTPRDSRKFMTKEDRLSGEVVVNSRDGAEEYAQRLSDDVSEEVVLRRIEDRYVAPSTPSKPVPVRTPAKVMRVWIAPWQDKNENLKVSSYVFSEIEERKWLYDMRGVARDQSIQPLQIMKPRASDEGGERPDYSGQLPGNFE